MKNEPKPLLHRNRTEYPHHKRAEQTYSQWLSGYSEEEVADFFGIEPRDVELDVQHVHGILPTRTVIAQNHDRSRILVQRQQSEEFRRLMGEALKTSATDYLSAGISPAGILKEFREAVGQIQKPEPLIRVNAQLNITGSSPATSMQIRSAEDLIRMVLAAQAEEESQASPLPEAEEPSPTQEQPDDSLDGPQDE